MQAKKNLLIAILVLSSAIAGKAAHKDSDYGTLMAQWVGGNNPFLDANNPIANRPNQSKKINHAALMQLSPEVTKLRKMTDAIAEFSAVYNFEEGSDQKCLMKSIAGFYALREKLVKIEGILAQAAEVKEATEATPYSGDLTAQYDIALLSFLSFFAGNYCLDLPSWELNSIDNLKAAVAEIGDFMKSNQ